MADSDQNRPSRLNIEDGGQPYPLEKMTGGQRQRRAAIHNLHDKTGRLPPQAVEVEQSVLGAMLIENEAIPQAIEVLPDASAFYDPRHRRIYQAIQHLFEKTDPVDLITLTDELKRRDELEDAGGAHYLTELSTQVASAANVSYHARIIAEKALLRQMIETMTGLVGKAYDPSADAFELLDAAESDIFRISDTQVRKAATSMKEVLKDTLEQLESIHGQEGGITGVPSGFSKLDRLTSGWQDSDLIIVAARPSMGKTAFSLACGLNAATHPKRPTGVAIFSLEMGAQQLAQRLLTSEARVNAQAARTGRMTDDDWQKLARAAGKLSEAQVFIDDTPGLSVLELRAKARRLKAEHDIGLLIVDYLQLMHAPTNSRSGNREQEIAQISRSLKSLAKELDIPVIALSQLSRAVENRGGDKRPQLSDLRESGCLTGDTLVPVADSGARIPMRDLCGTAGFKVWAVNPDTYRLEKRAVTNSFCTGTKPVYRLQTQLGREVRATGNHKFLTMDGWKRLDALDAGEHVALPRKLASPAEQSMTTDELALLGHLIGDGCTLPRHSIQYTTRERDLAEHVVALASAVFGADVRPRLKKERAWYQVYLTSTRAHTHGVRSAVSEWLDGLGVWGLRSHEKRVPERVFRQSQPAIATFLRHLWATDGCVRMRRGTSPYPAVYYATSSKRLAMDVQALLIRLGINARRKRVAQGTKGRDQHHIVVSGAEDLRRFITDVGSVGAYKRKAQAEIATYVQNCTPNTNRDVIPKAAWHTHVVPAMEQAQLSMREMQAALGMSYCGTTLYKANMSRDRAARVAGTVSSEALHRLSESDVYWDRIASITPDGAEKVYDLTVPGPQNFVANGIVVHNSIEQDADVVSFIYRAERYGITVDEHGNSTDGLAEIIIGKQRNGPIGTVTLAFVDQYARFENLTQHYGEEMPGSGDGYGDADDYGAGPAPLPSTDAPF